MSWPQNLLEKSHSRSERHALCCTEPDFFVGNAGVIEMHPRCNCGESQNCSRGWLWRYLIFRCIELRSSMNLRRCQHWRRIDVAMQINSKNVSCPNIKIQTYSSSLIFVFLIIQHSQQKHISCVTASEALQQHRFL